MQVYSYTEVPCPGAGERSNGVLQAHPSLSKFSYSFTKSFCFSLNSSFGEAFIFLICPEGGACLQFSTLKRCLFAARTKASC